MTLRIIKTIKVNMYHLLLKLLTDFSIKRKGYYRHPRLYSGISFDVLCSGETQIEQSIVSLGTGGFLLP